MASTVFNRSLDRSRAKPTAVGRRLNLRRKQSGLALAIVLVLMVTGAIAALFAFASPGPATTQAEEITQSALAEARSALTFRAAMDDNRPGSLPCPDTDNDGIAELLIGSACPTYVGRLPWQTLGLPDLRDANGDRLWYALSPSLRDDNSAEPINSETAAQLSVIGAVPATNVAALIIAPGEALTGQTRDLAGQNTASNYLEGENANGDSVYETTLASTTNNDRIATISRDQLFRVVEWRVARELRRVLRNYYAAFQYFPFANSYSDATHACTNANTRGRVPNPDLTPISSPGACPTNTDWFAPSGASPPSWFMANNWHLLTYYSIAPACTYTGDIATLNCMNAGGFLTVNGTPGVRAVIIVGGRAIGSQIHPCAAPADCVEQPLAATDQYQMQPVSATFNDRLVVVSP